MAQAAHDVVAGEQVRLRPQHQVAAAFRQAAVVHQQVADRHIPGHPRIVHRELRQVLHHRIVPAQPALLHQPRQHRAGHRLAVGSDLEQRLGGHRIAGAGHGFAETARVHHLAVLDHADRDAGQLVAFDGGAHHGIDRLRGRPRRCFACMRNRRESKPERKRCRCELADHRAAACSRAASSITACQVRSRLPPRILPMSASL